ncbi:MAG TPA: glycoside hydrolase family 36 protein [Spirochaetia bacterium]
MRIDVAENGIFLRVVVTESGDVRLVHLAPRPPVAIPGEPQAAKFRIVEVQESGRNLNDHHGCKHTGSCPGSLLRYVDHFDRRTAHGRSLEIRQEHDGLFVTSHFQLFDGIPVIRCWTDLENRGRAERPIEYVSSFALTGLSRGSTKPRDRDAIVHIPHSTWYGEAQWRSYTLPELGYGVVNRFSMKRICLGSTGTWPASEHLPMGSYENTELGSTITWQIETHASWHWEISDITDELYLQLSGPTYQESAFLRRLRPGESFSSEPCAVAIVSGGFEESIQALTRYRRIIRRPNDDNDHPSVIFNDYMNCLSGDPTTDKLAPLIDAAAEVGCHYFCIDAGWYADGPWWDGVGEWLPSRARFPGGIEEPLDRIRKRGMIPGLWLELEVMGINCPLVARVPTDWFFQRSGRPVIDEGRYQLDFRHPGVRAHADAVVRRLVEDYGVGYIKMDYNINGGPGTERDADSVGDGLLRHTRAYGEWLDGVFARYPNLVVENCGSGGMRMTYSLLSRLSIQSVTDQTDYRMMAAIAANSPTAVTPEQAGVWSYPLHDATVEETAFNMVNALLLRIHQSGHLAELPSASRDIVREGIAYHLGICERLARGVPFWPLGLASMGDEFISFGMECGETLFVAVWRTEGTKGAVDLPLRPAAGRRSTARCAFPVGMAPTFTWDGKRGVLHVALDRNTARVFEIELG